MVERLRDEGLEADGATVVVRRPRWTRVASIVALIGMAVLIIAIALVWIERRPIATHYLKSEFERRGVQASYHLDRVGLRTQEVSNLVIGDPKRPDLIARHVIVQMRVKWNGGFEVYRIVARGVRLRGRMVNGKVSWGQIDKMMPPPSNKPFALPDFVLDVADSSIALSTPFGPVGVALQGNGKLSGGFKGVAAVSSPHLIPGRCAAHHLHAHLALAVIARRPQIDGPVMLERFTCPSSRFDVAMPRFDAKASFNESFTSIDGSGRMAISTMTAGANGLAASFVPQAPAAATRESAASVLRFLIMFVGLTARGSLREMQPAPWDRVARRTLHWGWRFGRRARTEASSAARPWGRRAPRSVHEWPNDDERLPNGVRFRTAHSVAERRSPREAGSETVAQSAQ